MRKSVLSFTGIFVLVVILLLLNGLSPSLFGGASVDLTEEKLFSLSDGTKVILGEIEKPITFRYYFSKTDSARYPGMKLYGKRVENLLREYERAGQGRVLLEIYDPRPDSEDEEWAQKYGLSPIGLPGGERLFFGLAAANDLGEEEIIPVFNITRQEFLEYDITKLISNLASPEKPVVAVLSSINVKGEESFMSRMPGQPPRNPPWFFIQQFEKSFKIRYLSGEEKKIDEAVDVLMVIHPKKLSRETLYAIDQFVLRGGNLFVAVDPYCQSDLPSPTENLPPGAPRDQSSNLEPLLSKWGVSLTPKKAVADLNLAAKVRDQRGSAPLETDFVLWLAVRRMDKFGGNEIDKKDVLTANLENILLPWVGALTVTNLEGVMVEPLLRTTPQARLLSEDHYRFAGGSPQQLLEDFRPGNSSHVLAARIRGKLKSSFSGPPEKKEDDVAEHLSESKTISNVVVIADVDFLSDQYSVIKQNLFGTTLVNRLNDNLNFVQNAVENLSGSNELIGLRSRGRFSRPFTKVQEIERLAAEEWKEEEARLQAKLAEANRRLNELQSGGRVLGQNAKGQVFTKALLDEIQKFREERKEAQQKLREVRRNLRQDKERLGDVLFFLNTFFIPIVLLIGSVLVYLIRFRKAKK